MNIEVLEELTTIINRCYPETTSSISPEWSQITTRKLNEVIAETPGTWTSLLEAVKSIIKLPVTDKAYYQFPSYCLSIQIADPVYPDITCSRTLTLVVSLLCPYYTVYYEDAYRFYNAKRAIDSRPAMFSVIFSEIMPELFPEGNEYVVILQEIAEQHFPGYTYLRHDFLMARKVRGDYDLPWANMGTHTIFEYLFNAQQVSSFELLR